MTAALAGTKIVLAGAVVVAKLEEPSFPTTEIQGSNSDISNILSTNCTLDKTKIKIKRPGMVHL